MTVWVVTGSRPPKGGYTQQEKLAAIGLLRLCWGNGDAELVTGGARGMDSIAMEAACDDGLNVVTLLPSDHTYTDWPAIKRYSHQIIETHVGYWARDKLEVDRGDRVIALPLYERERSSRFSGTWHTWDVARRQNKHHVMLIVRGQGDPLTGPAAHEFRAALGPLFQRGRLEPTDQHGTFDLDGFREVERGIHWAPPHE